MATDAQRGQPAADGERDETPAERLDRNYIELLQELRVVQTGVQILFAFLLSLPFLQGFNINQPDRKWIYSATLLASALATAFLVAPVPYHRVVFRKHRKQDLVRTANRMALLGLICLLLSISGALYLVFDELWSYEAALITAGVFGVVFVALWFVLPVRTLAGPPERASYDHDDEPR
jgi:RsiW-degrading membrane proteinase PrsW (M82 family)